MSPYRPLVALLALALATAVASLVRAAIRGPAPARPAVLRAMLAVHAGWWAWHYAELWRPVNWEYAAPALTAWRGGLAFALAAPPLAAFAYVLAWALAGRSPLAAALVPLGWWVGYRAWVVQLLYWRAPGAYFGVHDDPYGKLLYVATVLLTAALLLYAAVGRAARRPRLATPAA